MCENCNGVGWIDCPSCDGMGDTEQFCGNPHCTNEQAPYEAGRFETVICPRCNGEGEIKCPECNGDEL